MKDNIKYSVLMAVYSGDDPSLIKAAADSMLSQTIKPDQFVIVVDGPVSDEIEEALRSLMREAPGLFRIVARRRNRGLASSLNLGLRLCKNEFVARMDADDVSLPERCEKELEALMAAPDAAVCGCQICETGEDGKPNGIMRTVPCTEAEVRKFMRKRQPFNHPTVIYRKSAVLACGGYPGLRRKEDFDLFSRLLSSGYEGINIPEALYLYRAGDSNYRRRKSLQNCLSAIRVYWRHFKRGGCGLGDFLLISCAEAAFAVLPVGAVKYLSENFLREKSE
ncbi:MAG: glycosyltransferase [Lachnospiraceae bacterium]|nr:glycosyltransferase [Lachnospiraceae bacterium]